MSQKGFQKYGNTFSYIGGRIKQNGLFNRAGTVMKHARRGLLITRIITWIIHYASALIAIIETSAISIILVTLLIILIPVFALSMLAVSLFSMYKLRKQSGEIAKMFDGDEKVMFIFAEHGYNDKKSSFIRGMSNDFAENGYKVFVVSRPVFKDGITAKRINGRLWVIKLNSFYIIKKRYLKDFDGSRLIFVS